MLWCSAGFFPYAVFGYWHINTVFVQGLFQRHADIALGSLVFMLPLFLISPILKPLVSKFGKKEISVIGCIFASFFGFLIYFLPSINTWTYLILLFFCTAGYTFINLLTWTLVADAIDYHEYITHRREEGIIYAIYSFSRKMGQASAGFLGDWVLIWVGYVTKAPV